MKLVLFLGFSDRGFEEYRFTLPQCSHDKQVGVYSCQEKLQGYDYVGVVDFDEYIVHNKLWSFKDILNVCNKGRTAVQNSLC